MTENHKKFYGLSDSDLIIEQLHQERPAIVVAYAENPTIVSEAGKALSRALRTQESLIEFYEPSNVSALLEAISRLISDLDVSALGGDYGNHPRSRLLMIDSAEDLSNDEVEALLKLVSGLKGMPVYALLLAHTPDGLAGEPTLRRLQERAYFWQADSERKAASTVNEDALVFDPKAINGGAEASLSGDIDESKITRNSRQFLVMVLLVLMLVLIGGGGWLLQQHSREVTEWIAKISAPATPEPPPALSLDTTKPNKLQIAAGTGQGSYVLSCGQYHDQELLDTVDRKVKALSPTRRVTHDGITELFAGGYVSISEAQKAITTLLPIGPCRTEIRTLGNIADTVSAEEVGGASATDPQASPSSNQGGKTHD